MNLCIGLFISNATRRNGHRATGRPKDRIPHLFAIFIRDYRTCGRAGIGTEYNSIFEEATDDCGTSASRLWHLHAFALEESIAIGTV